MIVGELFIEGCGNDVLLGATGELAGGGIFGKGELAGGGMGGVEAGLD